MSDLERKRHSLVGPAELWQMKRNFQITFLKAEGLKPHHRLCDIGCGTLRGGIPIIAYLDRGHYFGCDVRAEAIGEACRELTEHNLMNKEANILLSCKFHEFAFRSSFDFIWCFSVLFHLDDEKLDHIMGFASRHLADGGSFYANVNIGEQSDSTWREFPLVTREMDFYREACLRHGLSVSDLGTLHAMGHSTGIASQDDQRMLKMTPLKAQ